MRDPKSEGERNRGGVVRRGVESRWCAERTRSSTDVGRTKTAYETETKMETRQRPRETVCGKAVRARHPCTIGRGGGGGGGRRRVKAEKERDVGLVAVAKSCSTSVAAEDTSAGHAVRPETREAAYVFALRAEEGEKRGGYAQQKQLTATSEEQFAGGARGPGDEAQGGSTRTARDAAPGRPRGHTMQPDNQACARYVWLEPPRITPTNCGRVLITRSFEVGGVQLHGGSWSLRGRGEQSEASHRSAVIYAARTSRPIGTGRHWSPPGFSASPLDPNGNQWFPVSPHLYWNPLDLIDPFD
ncbi:hypothetical protein FB451DRAFT_1193326 [Mycena latifolia]|nr:hypothetical protein FB451DRAFT_1193326 [Mycena latifolia]